MMTTPQAPRMVNTSCEKESGERVSSGHAGRNPSRDTARSPKYRGGRGGGVDRVYSRAPPSSSRGSTGPTRGKPAWEGRWGRLREDDGGEGQRRSEADELTNPTPDARGAGRETAGRSGDSHAMPRVCWAMGPLGTALRRRARGAEARRIPDMVWLRRIVPASVTQGGRSTRVQEDSSLTQEFRVQSLDTPPPLALPNHRRRQDKSTRENSVVKVRADSPVGAVSPRHTRRFDQILTETHSPCSPASRRALASPLSAGE